MCAHTSASVSPLRKVPKFQQTIALQRFVLSIGIGFRTAVATALRQLAIARRILPERTVIV